MDGTRVPAFCRLWRAQRWQIYIADVRGIYRTFTDGYRQEDAEW